MDSKEEEPEGSNWNIPNALCVGRMALTPVIAASIVNGAYVPAVGMVAVSAVSDWADGKIAVAYNQKTVLGSFLDPAADKVLITGLSLSMASAALVPWWMVSAFVVRDVGLLAGAFYLRAKSLPPGSPPSALWDVSGLKSLEITPSTLSKVNTFGQMSILGAVLLDAAFGPAILPQPLLHAAFVAVTATTLASGASYALAPGMKRLSRPSPPSNKPS